MNELSRKPASVKASLNFAADATHGGIWSNEDRSLTTQHLRGHEVILRDARALAQPASIAHEGFERRHAPVFAPNWTDAEWVGDVYVPQSLALLKDVTGAAHVAALAPTILLRDTGNAKAAPAAEFVHIDQDRAAAEGFPDGIPYVSSVFSTDQKWYYFSNLTTDDAILFKNYDSDAQAPLGCLHGAFKLPDCPATIPRASVELRLFAFF